MEPMTPFLLPQSGPLTCLSSSFTAPDIFGAEVLSIEANHIADYSYQVPHGTYVSHEEQQLADLEFCNVSIVYTHPGQLDYINTQVWLPITTWNGRLQGSGGGGFKTGLDLNGMAGAIGEGFAVVSTDGGHEGLSETAEHWALLSPGNVNLYLLQDFASVALNDSAYIGKDVVRQFYGRSAKYAYWNGCSTGGRQGLMFAQRYPEAWNGILAAAPAINFERLCTADFWPQAVLNDFGERPHTCELEAISAAAIEACDDQDGVVDGIISAPDLCAFDAAAMLGRRCWCAELRERINISKSAVVAATAVWGGIKDSSENEVWPGFGHEASVAALAGPRPFAIAESWLRDFIYRGRPFDAAAVSKADLLESLHLATQLYGSIISTTDTDLSAFARIGGKMITWHGMADQLIPPNATRSYHQKVAERLGNVDDVYRLFEAPGVAHCWGGPGPFPYRALNELMDWVEQGIAPNQLSARSFPDADGSVWERPICKYPSRAQFDGKGDAHDARSWSCLESR